MGQGYGPGTRNVMSSQPDYDVHNMSIASMAPQPDVQNVVQQ